MQKLNLHVVVKGWVAQIGVHSFAWRTLDVDPANTTFQWVAEEGTSTRPEGGPHEGRGSPTSLAWLSTPIRYIEQGSLL